MSQLLPLSALTDAPRGPKVALVALGCAKNLVDAEQMLGALTAAGYRLTPRVEQAQVVIVNTCGFLQAARDEAVREIRGAARLKRDGVCETLVVSGCFAQLEPEAIKERCPEVDAVLGVSEFPRIAEIVAEARAAAGLVPTAVSAPTVAYPEWLPRVRATAPWTAYLKVAEGCDCACTFCTIPIIRGNFRSRAPESILAEARALAEQGVREVNLVAEDTTHYGHDLTGRRQLAELLRALGAVDGLDWVRLLYCYPTKVDDALIAAMAETPRVVNYVDMPLQHADDGILKAMNRGGRRDSYLRLLARLRAAMPDVCIRSTFIVGFPGEHTAQFESLRDFLAEAQLDRVGFFPYSPEPLTPAAALPGHVRPGVTASRIAQLAEVQATISQQRNAGWVGRSLRVLVEQCDAQGGLGRSYRDAPEIDGVVRFSGEAQPGQLVTVEIVSATTHDLTGRLAGGEVS